MAGTWFYDSNHVVLPVVRHRLCVDYFLSYAAYGFTLITCIWALVATLLSAGISNYFLSTGLIALAMIPWASYGEWAISAREAGHVYTYIVVLFWLCVGLIWSGSAGYIHLRQAKEAIEETWPALSAQLLLPFTTQLGFKDQTETYAIQLFGLAVASGLATLGGVGEGWKALGGQPVLVSSKWAWALPEAVTVLVLSGASASYAIYGGTISAWSTGSAAGVQDQAWHGSISLLMVLLGVMQLALPAIWGQTFLTHAVLGLCASVPSFILLVTSLVLQDTALTVDAWVEPRWQDLQQFVPQKFQGLAWDKYAVACYTPMQEAAMTGLILSIVLFCSCVYHLQTAALVWSVGPQLGMARARMAAQHSKILNLTATGLPAAIATATMNPIPEAVDAGSVSVRDWDSKAGAGGASSAQRWSAAPVPTREMSRFGPMALLKGTEAGVTSSLVASSPSKGGYGTASSGMVAGVGPGSYGAVPSSEDPLHAPLSASEHESAATAVSIGAGYQGASDGVHKRASASASSSSSATAAGRAIGSVPDAMSVPLPEGFAGGTVAAAEARARVAAMQQYQLLLLTYDKNVGSIAKRAVCPSPRQWGDLLVNETLKTARPFASCLFVSAWILLGAIIAISVGINQMTSDAACGVLGYKPATVTYSTVVQLESGGNGFANIFIDNRFPYGSVEVLANHVEGRAGYIKTDNVTIEITAYAADGKKLPSQAQLASLANISSTCFGPSADDDDVGGCLGASFVLLPGVSNTDALNQCLGMRIRIITYTAALYYSINSPYAVVNITGNGGEFVDSVLKSTGSLNLAPPTMQELTISTDKATIVGQEVYATRYLDLAPDLLPSLTITSNTGNVFLKSTVAQAVNVATSGNIIASTILSASARCQGVCGDISLKARGNGQVVMSQLIAAYNVDVSTDKGAIIMSNTGVDVAKDFKMTSTSGAVTLSTFLQLHSNNTVIRTAGSVSASAVFANVLDIATTGSSKVSITVGYLGLPEPRNEAGDIPFMPAFTPNMNYSYPALIINTERGDVSILSLGGYPGDDKYSKTNSVLISSYAGDIKVETSGGGVNANYTVFSTNGRQVVEIDGLSQPLTGQLGDGSDPIAMNTVVLRTVQGDVMLSELPSPL